MDCKYCGNVNSDNTIFCVYCGKDLQKQRNEAIELECPMY